MVLVINHIINAKFEIVHADINQFQDLSLQGHNQKLNLGAEGTFEYLNDDF